MADITQREADGMAELMYEARPGGVAAWVWQEGGGRVRMAVQAPAEAVSQALADASVALARTSLSARTRRTGACEPEDGVTSEQAFARRFVQERFLAAGQMRAGVEPFGEPELPTLRVPAAGEDYLFEAAFWARPMYELSSYDPVCVSVPAVGEPAESDVDAWLAAWAQQMGAPTIDDAWVATNMPELGSLAALRERVRAKLAHDAVEDARAFGRDACASELALRLAGEPDERLVALRAARNEADDVEMLAAAGSTLAQHLAQAGIDEEAWARRQHDRAHDELAREFALDALAQHLDLHLAEADIARAVRAEPSSAERERLEWYLETGQTQRLCECALRVLAADWLVDAARG